MKIDPIHTYMDMQSLLAFTSYSNAMGWPVDEYHRVPVTIVPGYLVACEVLGKTCFVHKDLAELINHIAGMYSIEPTTQHERKSVQYRYRPQRGGLEDSMKEMVVVVTLDELLAHLQATWWGATHHDPPIRLRPSDIEIILYSDLVDDRIGWEKTYLVSVFGSPLGFIDGVPEPAQ